jgi:hypothetical protein
MSTTWPIFSAASVKGRIVADAAFDFDGPSSVRAATASRIANWTSR